MKIFLGWPIKVYFADTHIPTTLDYGVLPPPPPPPRLKYPGWACTHRSVPLGSDPMMQPHKVSDNIRGLGDWVLLSLELVTIIVN